jgi:hypothetical protein
LLSINSSALADSPASLTVQAPDQMEMGDEAVVTAFLKDNSGAPIAGAIILLLAPADFLSVEGVVELDRATTDGLGIARLRHQARTPNSATLVISFPGNSQYSAVKASTQVAITGTTQLYQQNAGVRLPGVGVWLLVGALELA